MNLRLERPEFPEYWTVSSIAPEIPGSGLVIHEKAWENTSDPPRAGQTAWEDPRDFQYLPGNSLMP